MAGQDTTVQDIATVIEAPKSAQAMSREECEIHVASTLAEGFRPRDQVANGKPVIGADKATAPTIDSGERKAIVAGSLEVNASERKVESAIAEAARNRGRETNAFKATHDHLQLLLSADVAEGEKLQSVRMILDGLSKVKDWDKPQWFKKEPANWRDANGRRMTEHEFITSRNGITAEQMARWDDWAAVNAKAFCRIEGSAKEQIINLDDYLVRRVAVDSLKNWLRRRPEEPFIHMLFQALAQNKLYLSEGLRIRCAKDETGRARAVETREGVLYFEGTEEVVQLHEDEHGKFIELPSDTDAIIFEKRTVRGKEMTIPIAQPNAKDPNIQWFGGNQVKRGWGKEQRFFEGPQAFTMHELYGFFPEHFPMRITNSVENGRPTAKTGAAIYGFARDHAGRQARQLIAEHGTVMDGLKRNNSQLINDMRIIMGLQRPKGENPAQV